MVSPEGQLADEVRDVTWQLLEKMDAAFVDKTDNTVLFHLPVSTHFIGQVVLALMLIAKASYRDAIQFFRDIFDYPISIGTVASIVDGAGDCAASINAAYDLSSIRESAADEVFHRNQPILATVDINSRFLRDVARAVVAIEHGAAVRRDEGAGAGHRGSARRATHHDVEANRVERDEDDANRPLHRRRPPCRRIARGLRRR